MEASPARRTDDENSTVSLVRGIHSTNTKHAVQLHLALAWALERHGRTQLAREQYSVVLEDDSSQSERHEAEIGLLRTQNEP